MSNLGVVIMKIIETSIKIADYEKVCCNCKYFEQHYVLEKLLVKRVCSLKGKV